MFIKSSFERIVNPTPVTFEFIPFVLLFVSIFLKVLLSRFNKFIGEKITNIDVISARDCNLEKILEYDCILVDESQRLYEIDFNSVITAFKNFNRICIFAYDFYQVLSWKEEKLNIPDKLRSLDCFCEKHITEKIRTNYLKIVSFQVINGKYPTTLIHNFISIHCMR